MLSNILGNVLHLCAKKDIYPRNIYSHSTIFKNQQATDILSLIISSATAVTLCPCPNQIITATKVFVVDQTRVYKEFLSDNRMSMSIDKLQMPINSANGVLIG